MKVLIIGNGGREHAIAKKIAESNYQPKIYIARGNAGTNFAQSVDIDESDINALVDFALLENIDLTIVGSELPLSKGIVNEFNKNNLKIFGPSKEAAMIESSKKYAKALMEKYNIPTAKYLVCSNIEEALKGIKKFPLPVVLKFDGLAAGKGVFIAKTNEEVNEFLNDIFVEKSFGNGDLVIEEYLEGPEFSLMAFVNGENIYPMEIAQDHKRAFDGDQGPNTGGMGAYSPVPLITENDIEYTINKIMKPVAKALVEEGCHFLGVLYGGLMKTKEGIKVIEFNARFGDPETEVVLPRLENDLLEVIVDLMDNKPVCLNWSNDVILGVVMASCGYPEEYEKGYIINNISKEVIHMGTTIKDSSIITNGGRVLFVLGRGRTFTEAQKDAYKNVKEIKCDNLYYRNDIGYQMINLELKK